MNAPVGERYSQDEQGKLCTSIAVGCAHVSGPEGGILGDCPLIGSGASVWQREVEEGRPARGASVDGQWRPFVNSVKKPLTEQRASTAKEVCCNHGVLGVHFPDEGHLIGDLLRATEGPLKWSPNQKGFLRDAVDNGVAPLLGLFACGAGGLGCGRIV